MSAWISKPVFMMCLWFTFFMVQGEEEKIGTPADAAPRYAVLLWAGEGGRGEIVQQGTMTLKAFRAYFLTKYVMLGERLRQTETKEAIGVLVAHGVVEGAHAAIAIPITLSKDTHFLCSASDDGAPPEFYVYATSRKELLNKIRERLAIADPLE